MVARASCGQVFFGTVVALAAFTSRRWRQDDAPLPRAARARRTASSRRLPGPGHAAAGPGRPPAPPNTALHLHITGAVVVIVGRRDPRPAPARPVRRAARAEPAGPAPRRGPRRAAGPGLRGPGRPRARRADGSPHPLDVLVTTLHQATGALLLAAAVLAVVWSRRLLSTESEATRMKRVQDILAQKASREIFTIAPDDSLDERGDVDGREERGRAAGDRRRPADRASSPSATTCGSSRRRDGPRGRRRCGRS